MHYYFLNNVAWYCDPDVMLLRYPLTLDQARAWATLQGLTGEALMSSDRLPDLSADRVAILKSVFPVQDIRPLDLFPSRTHKHIKEYLGDWKKGIAVTVSPTSCGVLTLLKDNGNIQLISTNRHITQGYVDLVSLKYDEKARTFHGTSRVIKNAPYEMYFVFPHGENFVVRTAKAGNLKVKIYNHIT